MNCNTSNPWETTQEAINVLVELELLPTTFQGPNGSLNELKGTHAEFSKQIIGLYLKRDYNTPVGDGYACTLEVQLTDIGFEMFMKHLNARAEYLGIDEADIKHSLIEEHNADTRWTKKVFTLVPMVEFFTVYLEV